MGFDDDDFNNAKKANPGKNEKYKNTALYHQAGNSIVVPVLEAIFECLLPESEWRRWFQSLELIAVLSIHYRGLFRKSMITRYSVK